MKPNGAGIAGWSCLLLAVLCAFATPVGTINGAALAGLVLAVVGVVLLERAWDRR